VLTVKAGDRIDLVLRPTGRYEIWINRRVLRWRNARILGDPTYFGLCRDAFSEWTTRNGY